MMNSISAANFRWVQQFSPLWSIDLRVVASFIRITCTTFCSGKSNAHADWTQIIFTKCKTTQVGDVMSLRNHFLSKLHYETRSSSAFSVSMIEWLDISNLKRKKNHYILLRILCHCIADELPECALIDTEQNFFFAFLGYNICKVFKILLFC